MCKYIRVEMISSRLVCLGASIHTHTHTHTHTQFYRLWKDPEGLRVLASPEPQVSSEPCDTIASLSNEVEKLKSELQRVLNNFKIVGNTHQ